MTFKLIRRGEMRPMTAAPARPTSWGVPLCRDRLLEAADIDHRQTGIKRPRKAGNCHLTTAPHSHEERAGWVDVVDNLDHLPPTPADRARAEKIFGWLRMFTAREAELLQSLKVWLRAEVARDYSVAMKAKSAATQALDILTGRLNEAAVPVF
jgi:hypothetical protein